MQMSEATRKKLSQAAAALGLLGVCIQAAGQWFAQSKELSDGGGLLVIIGLGSWIWFDFRGRVERGQKQPLTKLKIAEFTLYIGAAALFLLASVSALNGYPSGWLAYAFASAFVSAVVLSIWRAIRSGT